MRRFQSELPLALDGSPVSFQDLGPGQRCFHPCRPTDS
jgi:hypothetical protein